MTDQQHRATPEQWALQERWGSHSCFEPDYDSSCILELRDRIAALEASVGIGQPVTPANTSAPADSLVEWVSEYIAAGAGIGAKDHRHRHLYEQQAHAAIRGVASWLRSKLVSRAVADRLEQEAER
jgi:hypothetical protein